MVMSGQYSLAFAILGLVGRKASNFFFSILRTWAAHVEDPEPILHLDRSRDGN
jgi:hypothetical protein